MDGAPAPEKSVVREVVASARWSSIEALRINRLATGLESARRARAQRIVGAAGRRAARRLIRLMMAHEARAASSLIQVIR